MNRRHLVSAIAAILFATAAAKITVDSRGVMRDSSTGEPGAWYGTNYTTPFAHAYRALGYLGVDRKEAIRKDAYHLARLGLNAFRLHLWEAEIADSAGNLLENDHLDLLDYTIAEMERRGLDVILTAQTNFGNGYPERNTDTGAFTYDYPKCGIHEDKRAQTAQARYLDALVRHVNPYTGLSYGADPRIIAMEINNEPCHSGSRKEVTAYINRMARTIRRAGFDKPVLYNVSHNDNVREAYYDADIDGTTYQWYPVGLVSGRRRKGNMLPAVSEYAIPWEDTMRNYGSRARVIYEFDPGDELDSYLYPAIVRTLRGKGFQWITQFAYDPIDLAPYNTEYPTHYLNLAYTPRKAIGMMIAAEAMRRLPAGEPAGPLTDDFSFGPFHISYAADLAEMNTPQTFLHTGTTSTLPVAPDSLRRIAGTGNSPVVGYEGSGAYFLDRLAPGVWRLEVMPDIVLTRDPFAKPSLNRRVGHIIKSGRPMRVSLPDLGKGFPYRGINAGNTCEGTARGDTITVWPGVYLLGTGAHPEGSAWGNARLGLGEYVEPAESYGQPLVVHTPPVAPAPGTGMTLSARVYSALPVDSVVVFPGDVSFWRDDNRTYRMTRVADGLYTAILPAPSAPGPTAYNITVYTKDGATTFPPGTPGTPLSWDYPDDAASYTTLVRDPSAPVRLFDGGADAHEAEMHLIPSAGAAWGLTPGDGFPDMRDPLRWHLTTTADTTGVVIRKYVADLLTPAVTAGDKKRLSGTVSLPAGATDAEIGFVTRQGHTYTAPLGSGRFSIPLGEFRQTYTDIVPEPYPSFMNRRFIPAGKIPFAAGDAEFITLRWKAPAGEQSGSISAIYLE